jgi:hypothetical protein
MQVCRLRDVLCVCVLENHVLRGTRIDRKITARDVLNSMKKTRAPLPGFRIQAVSSYELIVESYRNRERIPRQIGLSQRLASSLWVRLKYLLEVL